MDQLFILQRHGIAGPGIRNCEVAALNCQPAWEYRADRRDRPMRTLTLAIATGAFISAAPANGENLPGPKAKGYVEICSILKRRDGRYAFQSA